MDKELEKKIVQFDQRNADAPETPEAGPPDTEPEAQQQQQAPEFPGVAVGMFVGFTEDGRFVMQSYPVDGDVELETAKDALRRGYDRMQAQLVVHELMGVMARAQQVQRALPMPPVPPITDGSH
jgi:hypothetical protein